jgi:hypothetical protein
MEPKVVIEQRVLRRCDNIQCIAHAYIGAEELRVYAPARASGDPVQWEAQMSVHRSDGYGDVDVPEPTRSQVIHAVLQELQRSDADAAKAEAAALYCEAQICVRGDVQSSDGASFDPNGHCTKCGAPCIDRCPKCKTPIRGRERYSAAAYECPSFCPGCGHPYPWMEDKLATAHDLLFHAEKLTHEEKVELWDLLHYVMANPTAELAKGKMALIKIKMEKAAGPIQGFVTDLIAKYAAEMSK